MAAGAFVTLPDCVAVGVVERTTNRVVVAWTNAPREQELSVAAATFERLVASPSLGRLLRQQAEPRELFLLGRGFVHLFAVIGPRRELCVIATCRARADVTAAINAFRVLCQQVAEGA
jgi:hypothetical protein